jgi:hypothetical protein
MAAMYARAARLREPASSRAAALEVRSLLRSRDFDGAVAVSSVALERVPEPGAELIASHASALFRLQRTDEAARAYRRVLELAPLHAEAHVRLGSGLIENGASPDLPELDAAVSALRRGDLAVAIDDLAWVVRHHPDHAVAHRLLGEALLQRKAEESVATRAAEFDDLSAALPARAVAGTAVEKFMPAIGELTGSRREVAMRALATFESYLPRLAAIGGRHDLLLELERTTDAPARANLRGKRTFDGRVWDDVRGIGGLRAATGIEALDDVLRFGFDTLSHEIAHQVHLYGFKRVDRHRVRDLFPAARDGDHFLDYYAANNEAEYFGQGVEAFVSFGKRPGREPTHGHTRFELYRVDRALHDFIAERVDWDPLADPALRVRILPAAVELALRCGRPEDAVVAAEMMDRGPERAALLARARRALAFARSY